jgi:uncharacterized protein YndB with AHSA1/START domain
MNAEPNAPTVSTTSVTVERFIPATAARLYRALTVASELEQWFFSDVQTDPRAGGTYKMRWRSKAEPARDHDRFGRYLELVPDRKVVFEWKGDPSQKLGMGDFQSTIVTITLSPARVDGTDGTNVKLVHAGWPTSEHGQDWAGKHEGGWTFYLGNLSNYLGSGPDMREAHHGQAVKTATSPANR